MHNVFSFGTDGEIRGSDEFGVIAVYFENNKSNGLYGGQVSDLVTGKSGLSNHWVAISQDYTEPMEFTLQIINNDGSDFSQEQESQISKWLCKRGDYGWFFIQSPEYADIYIRCNINTPKVWYVAGRKGMQFTVTTDSAIAYSSEYIEEFEITDENKQYEIYIYNDEQTAIWPSLEIEMLEPGDLEIVNDKQDNPFIIKDLQANEIITVDGELPDIVSSIKGNEIYNSFNCQWLKLYDESNILSFNKKCRVTVKYREYRKLIVF